MDESSEAKGAKQASRQKLKFEKFWREAFLVSLRPAIFSKNKERK